MGLWNWPSYNLLNPRLGAFIREFTLHVMHASHELNILKSREGLFMKITFFILMLQTTQFENVFSKVEKKNQSYDFWKF